MDKPTVKLINNDNTLLTVIEKLPFEVKRIYTVQGMEFNETRGLHAHKKTRQAILCIRGSCKYLVTYQNGDRESFTINRKVIKIIEPNHWHSLHYFRDDCILLVLASEEYDEKDYIRDYEQFERTIY